MGADQRSLGWGDMAGVRYLYPALHSMYSDGYWFGSENQAAGITSTLISNDALLLHMNEGIGSVAYDGSFYHNDGAVKAHHGTVYGATWTTGKYGKALSFDGNDYVEAPADVFDRLLFSTN